MHFASVHTHIEINFKEKGKAVAVILRYLTVSLDIAEFGVPSHLRSLSTGFHPNGTLVLDQFVEENKLSLMSTVLNSC